MVTYRISFETTGIYVIPLAVGLVFTPLIWFLGGDSNPGILGFPLDDAWIHMVYAQGLMRDGFLSYNAGIPSTGCTSPIWAVLLALTQLATTNASIDVKVASVIFLGTIIHFGLVIAAAKLTYLITKDRFSAGTGGLFVALAVPLIASSFSGMEVGLTSLFLMLGLINTVGKNWMGAGFFLALAGLARPESAVVILIVVVMVSIQLSKEAEQMMPIIKKLLLPSAVAGTLVVAYNLWASGLPLPATFYAKETFGESSIFKRLFVAFTQMLALVPPFTVGLGWLALLGYRISDLYSARSLPLIAGLAYVVANMAVIDPNIDPKIYYHMRYVLPAVPMLLVAVAVGGQGMGRYVARYKRLPLVTISLIVFFSNLLIAESFSHRYHNDVRNINEVQRQIGTWLKFSELQGRLIAVNDAGAIKYFSQNPVVDVVGLNTPEMLMENEEFILSHPVDAIVLLPAWFNLESFGFLKPKYSAITENYTVTSDPNMAIQTVFVSEGDEDYWLDISGVVSFSVILKAGAARDSVSPVQLKISN